MEEEDLEIQQKATESIVTERRVLESHSNPYIMSTCASFQDGKNLYLVLDFEGGESLSLCLHREGRFNEVMCDSHHHHHHNLLTSTLSELYAF